MHNLWIPVVAIFVVAGLVFGSQAYSEAQRDAHIAATISERLDSQAPAEISHLTQVNKAMECAATMSLHAPSPVASTTITPPSA